MSDIIVLGAGMVGVSTALALQHDGHTVSLLDRSAPGQATSSGNAGIIQAEAVIPYPMPRTAKALWPYISRQTNEVDWRFPDILAYLRPLTSYYRASAPQNLIQVAGTYSRLIGAAVEDHKTLVNESSTGDLINKSGFGELYRDEHQFETACGAALSVSSEYDLNVRFVERSMINAQEPALANPPAGLVIWDDSWSCTDPAALTSAYAQLFEQRGGRLVIADADSVSQTGRGWRFSGADGQLSAEHIVVALGPWSGRYLRKFGYQVRMLLKRGYHTHVHTQQKLQRPYLDVAHGYVLAPMRAGLRLTTGVDFVSQNHRVRERQIKHACAAAADLIPLQSSSRDIWCGHRPCMPDMLPLVGPAPKHKNLWFNFGHGHHGFTLGPTTGRLVATMMREPPAMQHEWQSLLPINRL